VTHPRQIMLEELRRSNYAESTIRIYIYTVDHFSRPSIVRPISLAPSRFASIRPRCSRAGSWPRTPCRGGRTSSSFECRNVFEAACLGELCGWCRDGGVQPRGTKYGRILSPPNT